MREVAKSMLGFSWAVSLFGAQQLSKLVSPATPLEATAAQLEDASRAVQGCMDEATAKQFRAGDAWQRRLVDAVFDAAALQALDPRRIADTFDPRTLVDTMDPRRVVQSGVDLAKGSFETLRGTVQPANAG